MPEGLCNECQIEDRANEAIDNFHRRRLQAAARDKAEAVRREQARAAAQETGQATGQKKKIRQDKGDGLREQRYIAQSTGGMEGGDELVPFDPVARERARQNEAMAYQQSRPAGTGSETGTSRLDDYWRYNETINQQAILKQHGFEAHTNGLGENMRVQTSSSSPAPIDPFAISRITDAALPIERGKRTRTDSNSTSASSSRQSSFRSENAAPIARASANATTSQSARTSSSKDKKSGPPPAKKTKESEL